ncbi:hypothetical protein AJ80_09311 [Polytolypa hystricis UAMH7299]|uniref:Uncharacterized protein n=1 Tax=Polytolypa hystricis (strain UAMH7299) TaxID=1447883 RepID=A0A2B7WTC6_POLH7|nr:hypothetical protein AJ80_09311 [Polytolypa hystricis UAMH7299]
MPPLLRSSKRRRIDVSKAAALKQDTSAPLETIITQQQSTIAELTKIVSQHSATIDKLTTTNSRLLSTIDEFITTNSRHHSAIDALTATTNQRRHVRPTTSEQDRTPDLEKFRCPVCPRAKEFVRPANLNSHFKTDHREMYDKLNPSICPHCNTDLKLPILLHLSQKHPKLLPDLAAEVLDVDLSVVEEIPQGFKLFQVWFLKELNTDRVPSDDAGSDHPSLTHGSQRVAGGGVMENTSPSGNAQVETGKESDVGSDYWFGARLDSIGWGVEEISPQSDHEFVGWLD